ncbi:MAG: hypothetical protein EA381_15545 [Planctomycetaceae bacterium]|nr:MAG: hypothetical protein EA381_15545 [Planctomycetaceae bacterium]
MRDQPNPTVAVGRTSSRDSRRAATVLESLRTIVERLQRLVAAGTDTRADLQQAEADLLAAEIDGRKDIHEADSELSGDPHRGKRFCLAKRRGRPACVEAHSHRSR